MKIKNLLSTFVFLLVLIVGSLGLSMAATQAGAIVAAKKCNCIVENTEPPKYGRIDPSGEHCVNVPCWRPLDF